MDTPRAREPFRIGRFSNSAADILMPACSQCSERRHKSVAAVRCSCLPENIEQRAAASSGCAGTYIWR